MKNIVIIAGPTAVGKTATTVSLAKHFDTEIISADSMQIYQKMLIGSAKPTLEEQQGIKHHLMDCVDPFVPYSVSDYQKDAKGIIAQLHEEGRLPIVTGGTGLYINSLLYQMDFSGSSRDEAPRLALQARLAAEGLPALYAELERLAPAAAARMHPNNVHKVLRGLEMAQGGGEIKNFATDLVPETAYNPILIVLTRDRQELYDRINLRVDLMLEGGLIEEVKSLMALGLTAEHQSMKGIGYKEVIAHLNGQSTYQEMVETLKQNSRRYAKRQLTWFKRYASGIWINLSEIPDPNEQINAIIEVIARHRSF